MVGLGSSLYPLPAKEANSTPLPMSPCSNSFAAAFALRVKQLHIDDHSSQTRPCYAAPSTSYTLLRLTSHTPHPWPCTLTHFSLLPHVESKQLFSSLQRTPRPCPCPHAPPLTHPHCVPRPLTLPSHSLVTEVPRVDDQHLLPSLHQVGANNVPAQASRSSQNIWLSKVSHEHLSRDRGTGGHS